jgi:hypothetical protein
MTAMNDQGQGMIVAHSRRLQWIASHELPRELSNCLQVLEALSSSTEEEFLSIGAELRDLQARSDAIMEKAAASVRQLSGERVSGVIIGMDIFAEQFGLCSEHEGSPVNTCLCRAADMQGTLAERYRSAARMADHISDRAEELMGHIFAMVTFLQFHDITRQQFERSLNALRKVLDSLRGQGDGPGCRAGQDRGISVLAGVLHFCNSQTGILQRTREDFLNAAEQVVVSLRCIGKVVRDIMAGTSEITGDGAEGLSFLNGFVRELAVVKEELLSFPASGLDDELEGMMSVLNGVDRDIAVILTEIGEAVPDLLQDLERTAGTMTIHTIVDSITGEITARLGNAAEVIRRELPDADRVGGPDRAADSKSSSAEGHVELF